ncbi:hypothetical protein ACLKA7_001119 [Drosophila subpalustris]
MGHCVYEFAQHTDIENKLRDEVLMLNHFNKCSPRDFRKLHVQQHRRRHWPCRHAHMANTPTFPLTPAAAKAEIIGISLKLNKYA